MVEYVTREEVVELLRDVQNEVTRNGVQDATAALSIAIVRAKKMYAVRPNITATWKTMGASHEFIFCGGCGFKTLAYKRTPYCPKCGRSMTNGVAI